MTDMNASTFSRVPLDDVNYISLAAFAAKNDAMCEVSKEDVLPSIVHEYLCSHSTSPLHVHSFGITY